MPHRGADRDIEPDEARFIESVWIDPELRGSHLGERLVRFLFEVECAEDPEIKQFLALGFREKSRAIRLYQRMGFVYTPRSKPRCGLSRQD